MRILKVIVVLIFTVGCLNAQAPVRIDQAKPLSIGEVVKFESEILKEERILNIYLPNGYHPDSSKSYPVIYLLDGSIDEDFIHIAGLVQFGSFPWINMLPESIVVGIANVDRKRDFTFPTTNEQDKKDFPTTGGSAAFIDFLEKELQAFIKDRYSTSSATLIGQSLGGLLATEILFKRPQLFQHYIIVSPSLWWDDESLLKFEMGSSLPAKSVYVAVGKEGPVMERTAKELYDKLALLEESKEHLFFQFLEEQDHGDALHLAVYHAFEKLFSSTKKD